MASPAHKSQGAIFSAGDGMGLRLLLSVVLSHFHWIILAGILGAAISGVWTKYFTETIYDSSATIMPKTGKASGLDALMGQAGRLPGLGAVLSGGLNPETMQFQLILKTHALALKVINSKPELAEKINGEALSGDPERFKASAARRIRRGLDLKMEGPALHLRYSHEDSALAYEIVSRYLEMLQNFLTENIVSQSKNAEVFIRDRLKELTEQANATENRLGQLRVGQVRPAGGHRSIQSEIAHTQREFQRLVGVVDFLSQQYELSQIESKRNDLMFLVIDPPVKMLFAEGKKVGLKAFMGFVLGVLLAAGIVLALRQMRLIR